MKSATLALAALVLVCLPVMAAGQIHPVLSYQGFLADSAGSPYPDGEHEVTFSIYVDSESTVPLWTESQTVGLKRGLIHAYLGSVNPFPEDLFETYPLYLGIRYETEDEFSPRHLLSGAAYSFMAANSEKLQGHAAEHFIDSGGLTNAIADHRDDASAHHTKTTDAAELTSGRLDPDRLPIDGVDSDHIADGAIATGDLADSAVTGVKLAAGSVSSEHLSVTGFTGEQIADGSLTGVDLADSAVTGDKIASGAIGSGHLSGSSFTGDNIADGSLTGADIQDGTVYSIDIGYNTVSSYNIANGTITGDDVASNTITGVKIMDGSIGNSDLGYGSVGTAQIIDNSVRSIDVYDNTLTSADMADEPGLDHDYGYYVANVDTVVSNWLSVTITAPGPGYVIGFLNCITQLNSGEIAQAGVSNTATTMGGYGEAKIVSSAYGTGANMSIAVSEIIEVTSAGNITVYGNVRAAPTSTGNVDFREGRLQVIYIATGY